MPLQYIGLLLTLSLAATAPAQERVAPLEDIEPAVDVSIDITAESAVPEVTDATRPADVRRVEASDGVMDVLDLDRSEITGNQELPKVLYIVPWQKSDPGELMGKPVNTLLDEVLAPVERGEFVRQIRYYEDLQKRLR